MKNPKIIKLKKITSSNGKLIILEKSKKIDLNYKRFFTIFSNKKSIRGNHAHKKCYQILICLNGKIEVNCELKNKKNLLLY